MFLTIEGQECAGKSLQVQMLADKLKSLGYKVFKTKEPGSEDPLCKSIRQILLDKNNNISSKAALFLFLADRAQHIENIKQAVADNYIVVSDRSSLSTFCYFAAETGRPYKTVALELAPLLDFAQNISPDVCFVCNAEIKWSMARLEERKSKDRIESFDIGFHQKVGKLFEPEAIDFLASKLTTAPRNIIRCPPAGINSPEVISDFIFKQVSNIIKL